MSSTASNVSATPAVAPSPWPQTAAAGQSNSLDNGGGPFAAMLDAAAAAPDTAHTQPQPAGPRTSTAADQPAAKFSTRRTNGTTGTAQTTTPDAKTAADATKNANATATLGRKFSRNGRSKRDPERDGQSGRHGRTDRHRRCRRGTQRFRRAAATIVTDATANAATPDATTKNSSDNQDDSGNGTDATTLPQQSDQRPGTARRSGHCRQCAHQYAAGGCRCGHARHGDRRFGQSQRKIAAADRRRS